MNHLDLFSGIGKSSNTGENIIMTQTSLQVFTKAERVNAANELIKEIAACGRSFFLHNGVVSYLAIKQNGRVWFFDSRQLKWVYIHRNSGKWSGFSEGGTLRDLVICLRKWITHGHPVRCLGPWPSWVCDVDPLGYGDDMERVRTKAKSLGIIRNNDD